MVPRYRSSYGYTLIELLVVLAIIGILASVGVFLSQSPVPAAVKASTSSLAGAIRNAQTLALSSGQQVYLRTTGGRTQLPTLEWGFRVLNADGTLASLGPVQGTWTLPRADARYVSVGVGTSDLTDSSTTPLPSAVPAIASHVLSSSTIWTRAFFTGAATPTDDGDCPFFLPTGAINEEFAVTVAGARDGTVFVGGNRISLIVVSPRSGISSFAKQNPEDSSSPWTRI